MDVKAGLEEIRRRLVENQARPETIRLVDTILHRASHPAASNASAASLLQLVRMLMRNPVANGNPGVYDDLVRVGADLEAHAQEMRALRDAEESRPLPRTKKYYKQLRKKAT